MIFKPFSLSLKPYVNYVTTLQHSDFDYVSTHFRLRRLCKGRIREDLERMKRDYKSPKPAFRRSYALEAFMEGLSAGKKPKDLQSSLCRPSDVGLPDLCCLG